MVAVLTDTFARSVTDGWGTPDVGPTYTLLIRNRYLSRVGRWERCRNDHKCFVRPAHRVAGDYYATSDSTLPTSSPAGRVKTDSTPSAAVHDRL